MVGREALRLPNLWARVTMSAGEFVPPIEFESGYLVKIVKEYTDLLIQEWHTIGKIQEFNDENRALEKCIPKKRKFDDEKIELKNAIRRYDEKCCTGTP